MDFPELILTCVLVLHRTFRLLLSEVNEEMSNIFQNYRYYYQNGIEDLTEYLEDI